MKKKSYIREQPHECGDDWLEVDYFPVTESEHRASPRAKKEKASSVVQMDRNERHSRRWLNQLICTNFTEDDILLTLTYKKKYRPKTWQEARRQFRNYVRRINYHRKKHGLGPMEYIEVTEYDENGVLHHHVITRGDMARAEYQALWCVGRGPVEKRPSLGMTNTEPLRFDRHGITSLVQYLTKNPARRRRWSQSQWLRKPQPLRPNDSKFTRAKLHRACTLLIDDADYWQARRPGWLFMTAEARYCKQSGWYLYVRYRRPPGKRKP